MKEEKKLTLWERYLTREIGIEFKACLYFFAFLFFYCVWRMICGSFEASILHMGEMIVCCYVIGYVQVYAFGNFDEAECLKLKECAGMLLCTAVYGAVSYFCGWFEGKLLVTLCFAVYILLTYLCVFLIYRTKRKIDDKTLNEELKLFQTQHRKSE
ncbi:MAG: DUF3021 family protein [Lachnospiraceae bacterium]|nr:DUF3021 family protein [Lachnospiraceae bacterium]